MYIYTFIACCMVVGTYRENTFYSLLHGGGHVSIGDVYMYV